VGHDEVDAQLLQSLAIQHCHEQLPARASQQQAHFHHHHHALPTMVVVQIVLLHQLGGSGVVPGSIHQMMQETQAYEWHQFRGRVQRNVVADQPSHQNLHAH
jgi:hypothetical protein